MQWDKTGGRMLLFDKLTDLAPEQESEHPVQLHYSREQLFASVQKELNDLLNSRCKLSWQEYTAYEQTPYGLPALFGLWEESKTKGQVDKIGVADRVKKAIEFFEPRLLNVTVHPQKKDEDMSLVLEIAGDIIIDGKKERAFFPIAIESQHQEAAVQEHAVYDHSAKSPLSWPGSSHERSVDKT